MPACSLRRAGPALLAAASPAVPLSLPVGPGPVRCCEVLSSFAPRATLRGLGHPRGGSSPDPSWTPVCSWLLPGSGVSCQSRPQSCRAGPQCWPLCVLGSSHFSFLCVHWSRLHPSLGSPQTLLIGQSCSGPAAAHFSFHPTPHTGTCWLSQTSVFSGVTGAPSTAPCPRGCAPQGTGSAVTGSMYPGRLRAGAPRPSVRPRAGCRGRAPTPRARGLAPAPACGACRTPWSLRVLPESQRLQGLRMLGGHGRGCRRVFLGGSGLPQPGAAAEPEPLGLARTLQVACG